MTTEAGWPYQRIETLDKMAEPSWDCPTGTCTCAAVAKDDGGWEFSVMLCEQDGTRMGKARCRVVINGILANEDDPYADRAGWITVACHHAPTSVLVEWAPHDTPRREPYPYRRRYYVDLREDDPNERVRRRLHNLGFSYFSTLHDNICDFQAEYDYQEISGEAHDIEADVRKYHDEAMVPLSRHKHRGADQSFRLANFDTEEGIGGGAKAPPQRPPAQPATKGKPKAGNDQGQGTAKTTITPGLVVPNIVDVFKRGDGVYKWWGISAYGKKGYMGVFWIFIDAFKDKASGLRLPCRAAEAQIVADNLLVGQRDLPGWGPVTSEEKLPCLLLTPKLMDAWWDTAKSSGDVFRPCPQGDVDGILVTANRRMNRDLEAQIASRAKPPFWIADPGKIWAVHQRMNGKDSIAINYGWHYKPGEEPGGMWNGATPGHFLIQSTGARHDAYHIDYSQILLLVAGWCQVETPSVNGALPRKTVDVYRDTDVAHLVSDNGLPLPYVRQAFDQTRLENAQIEYWEKQERKARQMRLEGKDPLTWAPPQSKKA